MKFSLSWLKQHLETDVLPHAIADKLTPFAEFNEFIGLDEIVKREKQFES